MRKYWSALLLLAVLAAPVPAPGARAAEPAAAWDATALVKAAAPSVVGIVVSRPPGPGQTDDRLDVGSGFVLRPQYVMTAAHRLVGATRIRVVLHNGIIKDVDPRTALVDDVSGLAVLPVKSNLPAPVKFAAGARVGELAVAMGNPFGLRLGNTVSAGIISGVARLHSGRGWGGEYPMLQTDASINRGSGGGPLFNARGEVMGVNLASVVGQDVQGMTLAVPADVVQAVAAALLDKGRVVRPWLSLYLEEDPEAAAGLPSTAGLRVAAVYPGGPGAGVARVGDRLMAVDGAPTHTLGALDTALAGAAVGKEVALALRRGKAETTAKVKLQARPPMPMLPPDGGTWRRLTLGGLGRALDYGRVTRADSIRTMTLPYRAQAPNAEAVLETEFLFMAANVRALNAAGKPPPDNDLFQMAGTVRGYWNVHALVPAPGSGTELTALLVQGARRVPGTAPVAWDGGVDYGLGDDLTAPAGQTLRKVSFGFSTGSLSDTQPVTVSIRTGSGAEVAAFTWDPTLMR